MALHDSGDELYAAVREILMPLAVAAVSGGGLSWFAARRKHRAEAEKLSAETANIDGDLFERQVKLLAALWEKQNDELKQEIAELRQREDRREAEIVALRKALDKRTQEQAQRTVAFVPPVNDEGSGL